MVRTHRFHANVITSLHFSDQSEQLALEREKRHAMVERQTQRTSHRSQSREREFSLRS